MNYLAPNEYENYGIEKTTLAAWIAAASSLIDAHCRRMGTPIGENDTWIAATVYATRARLLTTDHDFDHLDPTFLTRNWIDPEQYR